jgi:large subunit ribosomal protein L24
MRIKKNDNVKVIAGNSKGLEGKVLKVFPDTKRVIVEKVKLIKRHTRQTDQQSKGGIVEKEAPISISNVMLICPKCNKPSKTSVAKLADGRKVRRCKRCKETLGDDD